MENSSLNPDISTKVTLEIEHFHLVKNNQSKIFTLLNNGNIKFDLCCYPNYCLEYFGFYAMIYLFLRYSDKKQVNVRYRLSILNANGDKCQTQEGIKTFATNCSDQYGAHLMIPWDYIFNPKSGLLDYGKFTIYCEIEEIGAAVGSRAHQVDLSFRSLSQDYQKLLECGQMADAVLVVGTKDLPVHKLILSTRSPVFAAMFAHSTTKEAQENRVEITDVEVEVLEEMLKYIYTGKVEFLDRLAAELLIAADKYQIESLKIICEQFLCTVITTKSVSDLLLFADLHRATELNMKCYDYISDNGVEVMASEGWKKIFVKPDLMTKVFERMSLKISDFKDKNKGQTNPRVLLF